MSSKKRHSTPVLSILPLDTAYEHRHVHEKAYESKNDNRSTVESIPVPLVQSDRKKLKSAKIQYAQKCAFCGKYITSWDKIANYNGSNSDYQGWMCHAECCIGKKVHTPIGSTDI